MKGLLNVWFASACLINLRACERVPLLCMCMCVYVCVDRSRKV